MILAVLILSVRRQGAGLDDADDGCLFIKLIQKQERANNKKRFRAACSNNNDKRVIKTLQLVDCREIEKLSTFKHNIFRALY